jgi:hypothetical protein
MFEYRVTKYDPAERDVRGAYRRDEWILFSQIGSSFGGELFTAEQYRRVEDAYVAAALGFWREVRRPAIAVRGLENARGSRRAPSEGAALTDETLLAEVIRGILQEEFWCRLEGDGCFLHFGWDYYMYIGVSESCPESCALAGASGLFVEPFVSPYHPESA